MGEEQPGLKIETEMEEEELLNYELIKRIN